MEPKRLNEIFKTPEEFGSFFKGVSIPEWKNISTPQLSALSIEYILSNGQRYISTLLDTYIKSTNSTTTEEILSVIQLLFTTHYGGSLSSLYRAMFSEYNPIENYMMVERGNDIRNLTDDTTDTHNKQNANTTITDGETTINNSLARDIKKAGFNIANPVLDTVETTNENDTNINNETVEQSGNETHTGQSVKTVTENNTHNFTRSGNIGVTTSQQMIESEIELRKKEYWNIVFKKLNDLITLSIY